MIRDSSSKLLSNLDFGTVANNLMIYHGVGLDVGPFSVDNTAIKIRSPKILPRIQGFQPSTTLGSTWTMLFYIKYNKKQFDHQPVITWGSSSSMAQIWLSAETGKFFYLPDSVTLPITGPSLIDIPDQWSLASITFGSGKMSSATDANNPPAGTAVSTPVTSSRLYIGTSNYPKSPYYSDLSISCFAIYPTSFSTSLKRQHAQKCQQFVQTQCPGSPPSPASSDFLATSTSSVFPLESVSYSCLPGYVWTSTGLQTETTTCVQSSSTTPVLSWSPSSFSGSCIQSASCVPSCENGATCDTSGGTPFCNCPSGFLGYTCAIDRSKLPALCNLISLWPLLSKTNDNSFKAMDVITGQHADFSQSLLWSDHGPFAAIGYSVPNFVQSSMGDMAVHATVPLLELASFTISTYVQFDLSVLPSTSVFYPVFGFANNTGLAGSPALYLTAMGDIRLHYVAEGVARTKTWSSATFELGQWVYISLIYNSYSQKASLVVKSPRNDQEFTSTQLQPPPVFSGTDTTFYIGSTDMSIPGSGLVFPGRIACLSIFKAVLTDSEIDQMLSACDEFLGSGISSPAADQSACNICEEAPQNGTLAMESPHLDSFVIGIDVTLICPPFTRLADDKFTRVQNFKCQATNSWLPSSQSQQCSSDLPPVHCDPDCLNGGLCICSRSEQQCYCQCQPGFTGPDCLLDVDEYSLPESTLGFWPLTKDSMIKNPASSYETSIALDYSNQQNHLHIGEGVGFSSGPYGNPANSFTVRSSLNESYLWSQKPVAMNLTEPWNVFDDWLGGGKYWTGYYWGTTTQPTEPFVIMLYLNYTTLASGIQPLLSFEHGGSAFYIEPVSGQLLYKPGDVLLGHTGIKLSVNQTVPWYSVTIFYNVDGEMGVSVIPVLCDGCAGGPWSIGYMAPATFTAVSLRTGDVPIFIGYDPDSGKASDYSISCLGIYHANYS